MAISEAVLAEINQASEALALAGEGDARAATDIAVVHSAVEASEKSQAEALSLHITASDLARKAIDDLRAELQLPVEAARRSPQFATFEARSGQHSTLARAAALGIPWGQILQALLAAGLPALEKLIEQWLSKSK